MRSDVTAGHALDATDRGVPAALQPRSRRGPAALLLVLGALGSGGILAGVSMPGSPFVVHGAGSWIWVPSAVASGSEGPVQFLGVALVYAGTLLLLGCWLEALRWTRSERGLPLRVPLALGVAWGLPIAVAPPLFSRDVFSYAAQGEMVARGINPYLRGPSALGTSRFVDLVDPLWRARTSPYGPAWERLGGWLVQLAGHHTVGAVVGFRVVALAGVALLAWGTASLAGSIGRDRSAAIAAVVLNPLVLLVLLGGAHNDALMLGLVVASCALAARRGILAALVLCALAAEVKLPALVAAAFIGWAWWSGDGASIKERGARALASLGAVAAAMLAIGAASGLGWRWITDLLTSGTVVSWLDPATAAGLAVGHGARALGYGGALSPFVNAARGAGLAAAVLISARLLYGARRTTATRALGWSLLAFVLLGPVVWPWYEAWGFAVLGITAERWTLRGIAVLSAAACFADVQDPHLLVAATPGLVAGTWLVVGVGVAWFLWGRRPLGDSALGDRRIARSSP